MESSQEPLVLDQLFALVDRFDLSDTELAGLTGLSPHTVRVVRIGRAMPRHAHCRRALREFVSKNLGVQSRGELRAAVSA